ncbi:MAG: DUF1116 domain-containing protein [Acidobacteria bacterium]|nr:DUF1116 domain-containing protein [Acidobacteriota bacterium]
MPLAIATIEAPLVDQSLREQGIEPIVIEWTPPARGDLGDVALLTRAYADDDVEAGNRQALALLDAARPHLVDAGLAVDLVPGMDGRTILHAGPPCDWDHLGPAMRGQVARAAVLEGWAPDQGEASLLIAQGAIALAPTDAHGVVATMCGVLSPSMAVWEVRDEETGAEAWAPISDGAGDGLPPGARTRDLISRQRMLSDRVAPGASAALAATGPIDLTGVARRAADAGDAPAGNPHVAGMMILHALLPGLATRALDAVPAIAQIAAGDGRMALPVLAAAARAALQSASGVPRSSLVIGMSGNGTDVAITLAGMPGAWFTAPAPIAEDGDFGEGTSSPDAAPWTGDQGVIACAEMAIDARLCLDAGEAPGITMGIASRADGAWIGEGVARVPLPAVRDALGALVPPGPTAHPGPA